MEEKKKIGYFEALIKYGKIIGIIIIFLVVSTLVFDKITKMNLKSDSSKNNSNKNDNTSAVENNNETDNTTNDYNNCSNNGNFDYFVYGNEIDINSDIVKNLYHRVSTNFDTPICIFDKNSSFYSGYSNEMSRMFFVGVYLSNNNSKNSIDVDSIPKVTGNASGYNVSINDVVGYYYTRNQVEEAYHTLYGLSAKLDTSIFIDDVYVHGNESELNRFIYDKNTDTYYSYNYEGGVNCNNENLKTAKLSKALQNNDFIILFQDINVYDDNDISDTFQYVYTFKKEANGEYVFISKMKAKKD